MTSDRRVHAAHTVRLLGEPRDVSVARGFLQRALAEAGMAGRGTDAAYVLSELVTNAVVHGRGPIDVSLRVGPDVVELHVHDHERTLPVQRNPATQDDGGRGMAIVAALSRDWWVEATGTGKIVHATVALAAS